MIDWLNGMPRHHVGVGHAVRPVPGVERAEDRVLVLMLRQHGQRVAEPNAGHVGRDHPELAADLLGGLGLGVEAVDVADAALEPEQDARDIVARRRSRPPAPGAARTPAGSAQSAASDPTRKTSRRVTPSQVRLAPMRNRNIESPLSRTPRARVGGTAAMLPMV